MIAIAFLKFAPKRPTPASHGGLYLAKAWDKYRFGEEISAACYLREALRHFLLAWCERDGVEVVAEFDRQSAMKIYKLWCRAKQQQPNDLMLAIITQCNQMVHLQPISDEFYDLLDTTQQMFEDEIDQFAARREGGVL